MKRTASKNKDSYGAGVVKWGNDFADLLDTGRSDFKAMSHETGDSHGYTGFMYGCMISAVAHFHPRGEEVRKWHNLDTQMHDEGEKANEDGSVLNPALITITKK